MLRKYKDVNKDIFSLKVFNKDGEYVGDDLPELSSKNVRDRDYFQLIKNNPLRNLVISKPVISKTLNQWIIVLAKPLLDEQNKLKGIAVATISLEKLSKIFSKLEVGVIVMYDQEGFFYTRFPWREEFIGKKFETRSFESLYTYPKDTHISLEDDSPIDQEKRLYTFRKISTYPFTIGVGYSKKAVLKEWKKRLNFQISSLFILALIGLYILFQFLTSQEQVDTQRRQSLQNAKLTSLGEMASGVAHEINNPLMVISGLAQSLKRSLENETLKKEKGSEQLNKIISTVDRIAKIIKGLRNFSRDSFDDEFVLAPLKIILSNSYDLCKSKIDDNEIKFSTSLPPEIDIKCREVQLVQVLVNLINNSIDAIANLEDRWINIKFFQTETHIQIIFTDSGKGISPEIAEKIMQPFYTTKEIGKGTGLGLSISKGIIEDHGGNLTLDSNRDHTTFIIELPLS